MACTKPITIGVVEHDGNKVIDSRCRVGLVQRVPARVSKGRDVPLSLCPGTRKFPCPVVPLSPDKKVLPVPVSLCPGTRAGANVPGLEIVIKELRQLRMSADFFANTSHDISRYPGV